MKTPKEWLCGSNTLLVFESDISDIQSDAAADAEARGVVKGLRMAAVIIDRKLPQIQAEYAQGLIIVKAAYLERELAAKEKV